MSRFGARSRMPSPVSGWVQSVPPVKWSPIYRFASTSITTTGSSTINTKGAWTEYIASTSADIDCLMIYITGLSINGTDTATLIDIGVGAAGSEVAYASNIAVGSASGPYIIPVPGYVSSGSRISIRCQSVVASKTVTALIFGYAGNTPSLTSSSVTTIGTSTATSDGIAMSGTNNTWVELTAATTAAYDALVLVPSASTASLGAVSYRVWDLGIGAAGSETAILSLAMATTSAEIITTVTGGFGCVAYGPFPAGIRLSARVSTSTTTVDACVIGVERLGQ